MNRFYLLIALYLFSGCRLKTDRDLHTPPGDGWPDRFLVVLGVAQDAGYPQAGCEKECCRDYYLGKENKKYVTCLALVDRPAKKYWLFEATPDIVQQMKWVQRFLPDSSDYLPAGIFLTHAHIGHYTGLMQLGREAMGAHDVPVWVMPRMDSFLRRNGPWSQLVSLENIRLQPLQQDSAVMAGMSFTVMPFLVPHRDEYSETVGFRIGSGNKHVHFIPDIDKWEKWDRDPSMLLRETDQALLDGTFYGEGELPGRDMREVPHPFVRESLAKFSGLPDSVRKRVIFIHFNHTNPLLRQISGPRDSVRKAGFRIAEQGMIIPL